MLDAVRGYLQMATGLTEVTMRKALEVAESLLGAADDTAEESDGAGATRATSDRVQDLADDIVSRATADKEALIDLVRGEIDRAAGRLGFVREEELAAVRRHVVRLEGQVVAVRAELAAMAAGAPARPTLAKPRSKPSPVASQPVAADPPEAAKPVKRKVPAASSTPAQQTDPAGSPQAPA